MLFTTSLFTTGWRHEVGFIPAVGLHSSLGAGLVIYHAPTAVMSTTTMEESSRFVLQRLERPFFWGAVIIVFLSFQLSR